MTEGIVIGYIVLTGGFLLMTGIAMLNAEDTGKKRPWLRAIPFIIWIAPIAVKMYSLVFLWALG